MVEYVIPTLTEIGYFSIQIVIFMILFQAYQWVKAKVEISKIKAEKERLALELSKPQIPKDIQELDKPDTLGEKIENSLMKRVKAHELLTKRLSNKKKEKNDDIIGFDG